MQAIEQRSKHHNISKHIAAKSGMEAMLGHPISFEAQASVSSRNEVPKDASGCTKYTETCYLTIEIISTKKNQNMLGKTCIYA